MADCPSLRTVERWSRITDVFGVVLDVEPDARPAAVHGACAGDAHLEADVLRLLALSQRADGFLETPVFRLNAGEPIAEPLLHTGELVAGRFRIVQFLGRGGMGEVYEATDVTLEEPVALKVMRGDLQASPELAERFRREVQLARRITHPSACRVHDCAFHRPPDGRELIVITMELVVGETLGASLRRGAMQPDEALAILIPVASALDAAHGSGVVHGDIKPSNVILQTFDNAKVRCVLTDFGLARASDVRSDGPIVEPLLGTPDYMAPELMSGAAPSPASDVYAFGVMLYEMLTGERPNAIDMAGDFDKYARPVKVSGVHSRWNAAIDRALQPDPHRRFRSAGALVDSLVLSSRVQRVTAYARRVLPVGSAASVAAALALLPAGSRFISQENAIVLPASEIFLTDVSNETADPELGGAGEVLRSQLAISPHFELLPQSRVAATLRRMRRTEGNLLDVEAVREVALREGAPVVAYAAIGRRGGDYVLDMTLERVGARPSVVRGRWARRFVASDKRQLLESLGDAAMWVRETVGEAPTDLREHARSPEDTTTSSWEALRLFAKANDTAAAGDVPGATLLLQQALRFDAQFATAHMRLGDLLLSLRRESEGYAAWTEALRLADKEQLTTREGLRLRAQYLEDTGDLPGAEQAYRTYLLHYPNDYRPTLFLGSVLADQGRSAEAVQWFVAASRLRPTDFVAPTHLTRVLLDLHRYDEAAGQIGKLRSDGHHAWATWLDGLALFVRGDIEAALRAAEPLRSSADPQWQSRAYAVRASWLEELGRRGIAQDELRSGITFDSAQGLREREADKWLFLATLQCAAGDLVQCRDSCTRGIAASRSAQRIMRGGTLLARAGLVREAEALLQDFGDQPRVRRVQSAVLRLTGEIHLAQGRVRPAVVALSTAAALAPERHERIYLARALRASGDLEGARRVLAEFLAHPLRSYFTPEPEFPGVWSDARREHAMTFPPASRRGGDPVATRRTP